MKNVKLTIVLVFLVIAVSSCSSQNSVFSRGSNIITREDAEEIAINYIQASQIFILHNGHDIQQTDWGRMENNGYMFVYEYKVDSESLPETVSKMEVTLEVIEGAVQNVVSIAIYE